MYVYETGPDGLVLPAYVVDGFDPAEPRDKDGKWGAGGDVAAASKAKAAEHEALAEHHFEQHSLKASVGERLRANLAEKGGATIDPSKSGQKANVRKGFAVSTELEHERQVPLKYWTPQTAAQYAKDKADVLSKPGNKIGSWVDKGTVFYDVSTVVDTAEKAAELGRAHKQLGFFDLEKKQTVRLMKKRDEAEGLDGFPDIEYVQVMSFTTQADGVLCFDGPDDEPRDKNGQWTSGGGGSGGQKKEPSPVSKIHSEMKRSISAGEETHPSSAVRVAETLPGANFYWVESKKTGVGVAPFRSKDAAYAAIEKASDKYHSGMKEANERP